MRTSEFTGFVLIAVRYIERWLGSLTSLNLGTHTDALLRVLGNPKIWDVASGVKVTMG